MTLSFTTLVADVSAVPLLTMAVGALAALEADTVATAALSAEVVSG